MKKHGLFLLTLFSLLLRASDVFAGDSDAIFDTLAAKAETIGSGLGGVGYVIAGFGLAVFSFMAIFNKISWKTLAYIMLSTFILSIMAAIVGAMSEGGNAELSYTSSGSGATGATGNVMNNPVSK